MGGHSGAPVELPEDIHDGYDAHQPPAAEHGHRTEAAVSEQAHCELERGGGGTEQKRESA